MSRPAKFTLMGASAVIAALSVVVPAGAAATVAATVQPHHRIGVSPMGPLTQSTAAPSNLQYFGGPVVSNAQVQIARWGAGTYLQPDSLQSFFTTVLHSPYISWLKEYDTPAAPTGTGQHIGYGTTLNPVQITAPSSATVIDDTVIQQTLIDDVNAGTLAPPALDAHGNVNTIYAVSFPQEDRVTIGTDASGVTFCAYHNSTAATDSVAGVHLLYAVLPDPNSPGMAGGCGADANPFNNFTSYASHELIEVITDPMVGGASVVGPPLAWYDPDPGKGEIGDLCNQFQDTVAGFTVQQEWSNSQTSCIATRPAVGPDAPQGLSAADAGAGSVSLTWSPPVNDGFSPITGYDVYRSVTAGSRGEPIASGLTDLAYTDTPPADGRYFYSVDATNSSVAGAASTQTPFVIDTTNPTISMTAPTSLFSLSPTATTQYVGSDAGSGVASYDVSYRVAKWNGDFGGLVNAATATTVLSSSITVALGREYCFSAVARDGSGKLSAPSTEHCQVAPLDDRSLTRSAHWTSASSTSAFRSTLTTTTTKGATLTLKAIHGQQLALVLQSCVKCGRVQVFVGKTLLATIDTHSASTRNRVIRILPAFSLRTADVRLVAADAGKKVLVDGLGVSLT